MKIVVIGGTGLIGSRLVARLKQQNHEAVPASPKSGVNAVTGEGLAAALAHADVVVDVANAPSWEPAAVLEFFERSSRNLVETEVAAAVKHHVALSIVGTERSPDNAYFRAKLAQETIIRSSPVPYSIVRATQFFEFLGAIAERVRLRARSSSPPPCSSRSPPTTSLLASRRSQRASHSTARSTSPVLRRLPSTNSSHAA
jgi:uncharacterized protein YbjT (DUF2867 family)